MEKVMLFFFFIALFLILLKVPLAQLIHFEITKEIFNTNCMEPIVSDFEGTTLKKNRDIINTEYFVEFLILILRILLSN